MKKVFLVFTELSHVFQIIPAEETIFARTLIDIKFFVVSRKKGMLSANPCKQLQTVEGAKF